MRIIKIYSIYLAISILGVAAISRDASADGNLKDQLKCISSIRSFSSSISSKFKDSCEAREEQLVFLADRHTRKGVYVFNQKLGKVQFFEFIPAPMISSDGPVQLRILNYSLTGVNQRVAYIFLYKDYTSPVSTLKVEDFKVSDSEVNQFVTVKGIPKENLTPRLLEKIKYYLKAEKKKKAEERLFMIDPNDDQHRVHPKFEFLECNVTDRGLKRVSESTRVLKGEEFSLSDLESARFLNQSIRGVLVQFSMDPSTAALVEFDANYRSRIQEVLETCQGIKDNGVETELDKIREILSSVVHPNTNHSGESSLKPAMPAK